jgi:photosystem II stability/assembly factor-like uncharacterized protein
MKCLLITLLALLAASIPTVHAQQIDPRTYGQLRFRFIGPQGNRVSAVIGEPGNHNVYYAGAASGGVWKSEDGGTNWAPIFDQQPAASIGALAIAPSDHNIIWAGTGESFIRSNVSIGNGIYKSRDGGKTWTHMGLDKTGRIARVVIDPRNPDIVLVAAVGHCYGPQPERGVFRTTDGGKTWERVLFVDENTGASDLAMDPNNPSIVFSGMWQMEIKTWGQMSGGASSGVFKSTDGGATWKRLTGRGLPDSPLGKVAVAVAQRNSNRVYALIETGGRGSLWRSDDGGNNWRIVNYSRLLNERPHYYTRMMVSPDNADEVYFPCNSMYVSRDGGESTDTLPWGGDNHDMWADPTNSDRMMIGYDGGVMVTTNHGRQWNHVVLPIGQMYHVAVDNRVPYYVYANMQDYYSMRGPSNSLSVGGISSAIWTTTAGCESGFSFPDPVDNNIVWGGCYAGETERYDIRTGHARSVSPWPDKPLDSPAGVLKYRWNWTHPMAMSPHDHNRVYVGSQYVHMTTDGGQTWRVISPDLTLNDRSKMGSSGGLTQDNLGVEYAGTLFAIAESRLEPGVIWTGSNDGQVYCTRDSGQHWTNVTANIPDLPAWGTISNIEPSRFDAGAVYITVDLHQVNNRDPYVYKTTDYGKTWKSLAAGIPKSVFSYAHCVIEDSVRRGLLYLGTENSLYCSFDDGATWLPLQSNLPHSPVSWLTIQEQSDDLVVATNGRGIFILDDLTPLQQLGPEALAAPAHLFDIKPAYRFRRVNRVKGAPNDQSAGRNPAYGASINYLLKSEPKGDVQIAILDDKGQTIRQIRGTKQAGINRVYWDLRYEPTKEVGLRTTPESHPHVWEEKRFKGRDTRPIYHYGIAEPKLGPLAAPGTYTVKLTVEGKDLARPLVVKKDPGTTGTEQDVQATVKMWVEVRDEIDAVVMMINKIELIRKQIEDLPKYLGVREARPAPGGPGRRSQRASADASEEPASETPEAAPVRTTADPKTMEAAAPILQAAKDLDKRAQAVEDELLQKALAASDTKSYIDEMKLYLKLIWLAGEIGDGAGDVDGNPDFPPTQPQIEVHNMLKTQLAAAQAKFDDLMKKDVPQFNESMKDKGITIIFH